MSLHDVWQLNFGFFSKKPVCVEPVDEDLSTDGGLLIFRQFDEQWRLTVDFAEQIEDTRHEPEHSVLEMIRSRVFGIVAGV